MHWSRSIDPMAAAAAAAVPAVAMVAGGA